jgi:RND family efflux transporter MFP subunit
MFSAAKTAPRASAIVLMFCFVAVLAGCREDETANADVAAEPRPVRVAVIGAADERPVRRTTGMVQAQTRVTVSFEIGGKIAALHVEEGDRVQAGDLLAELDVEPLRLALQQARAEAAASAAVLAEIESRLERQRQLSQRGLVAPAALAAVEAEKGSAVANAEGAAARIEIAERDLRLARLVAPVAGRIAAREATPFANVATGQTILEIDGDDLEVTAPVPLDWAMGLKQDTVMTIVAGDRRIIGSLREISPRVVDASLIEASIHLPAGSGLASGAFVTVEFAQAAEVQIAAPYAALLPGASGTEGLIFVVVDGKAVARPVTLSDIGQDRVWVASGLEAGETVVVAGAKFLTDGEPVRAIVPGDE